MALSRYVGVYNNQDWRSYTSVHANIAGQTLGFWKLSTAPARESGIVTACVSVADMLRWGREQLKKDPTCFLAGIR